jgi:Subtilase family/Fibronectin type-III domain/PA domain/Peptidase inhibitor I9
MLNRRRVSRSLFATTVVTATVTLAALGLGSSAGAAAGPPAHTAPGAGGSGLYIVQMLGDPLATAASTRPAQGKRLNVHSSTARSYAAQLRSRQDSALSRAGVSPSSVVYHYGTALNGVAVHLTATQADKLAKDSSVLQLFKNHMVTIATPPTPRFLGLTGKRGVWTTQFGSDANAGAGVIVGVIDTGFWPESPSFAPLPTPRPDQSIIDAKFHGVCVPGNDHPVTCNNKVIGARWYDASGAGELNPNEFHSPRDYDGHGSHTGSTAAGNPVQHAVAHGIDVGDLEGVAPAARVSVYKVLYENATNTQSTGGSVDIVAAINDAVNDGVDVINYSVGDNVDTFGPEEFAFLNAAAAGVFVSAAAGNAGPGAGTVDNAMPWETTVAAGTFDRQWQKTVTLGNGATYHGVGVGAAVPTSPLVDAATAALAGHAVADATLCIIGALDPAKVTGKIVLCARGVNNRTDKSEAVKEAGGVGMILWNPTTNSLNADFHAVPSIHVNTADGSAIKAYIAGTATPTASLSAGVQTPVEAPQVASFSSRGPSPSSSGNLLKPDVMGPGVDVIAAVSPANHAGSLYDIESGTSQATPHVTGVAALLLGEHADWAPGRIRSVIMTSAKTTDNEGNPITNDDGSPANPFGYGNGELTPRQAFDTQLVYDAGPVDWVEYSCSIGVHLFNGSGTDLCTVVPAIATSDFNNPSIAVGALTGSQTVTRTVTNITDHRVTYAAHVTPPPGYRVSVAPKTLVMNRGASATFRVTITRTTGSFTDYSFGDLRLTGHGHIVRSQIAVKAAQLAAPGTVAGTGTSGSAPVSVRVGYTGTLTAAAFGLVPASTNSATLGQDTAGFDPNHPSVHAGVLRTDFTVPAGTVLARARTFASDYPAGTDVDLFVYRNNGGTLTFAGQSAGGTADETVNLTAPGDYSAFVDVFALPVASATVTSYTWSVPATNNGNVTVTPAAQSVTSATAAPVTVAWSGLTSGRHYLGYVDYGDGTSTIGRSVVTVDS